MGSTADSSRVAFLDGGAPAWGIQSARVWRVLYWMPLIALIGLFGTAIGTGFGVEAVGVAALTLGATSSLLRWRRGIFGALVYLPFSGAVSLALQPWAGGLLIKDFVFILPAYLGWLCTDLPKSSKRKATRSEVTFRLGLLCLAVLVATHVSGSEVANWSEALIGAKVWLLYVPLYFLGERFVDSKARAVSLFRALVMVSIVPCGVGLAQSLLAPVVGYHALMEAVYGASAANVTQGFAEFEVGNGVIRRIPSTFTFVTQYSAYTLVMITINYCVWRSDPSRLWRRFGAAMFATTTVAAFLSGARSAFVFVPLLCGVIFGLDRGLWTLTRKGPVTVALLGLSVVVLGTGGWALYEHMSTLLADYSVNTALGMLIEALDKGGFWGMGTGTNTGPARYAFSDPTAFVALENYYAKAAYELGWPGLLVVAVMFGSLIIGGYAAHRKVRDREIHGSTAAMLGFMTVMGLNSFKGWIIDLDPVNVYFWLLAGMLRQLTRMGVQDAEHAGRDGSASGRLAGRPHPESCGARRMVVSPEPLEGGV